jgi:hypothetical protein
MILIVEIIMLVGGALALITGKLPSWMFGRSAETLTCLRA